MAIRFKIKFYFQFPDITACIPINSKENGEIQNLTRWTSTRELLTYSLRILFKQVQIKLLRFITNSLIQLDCIYEKSSCVKIHRMYIIYRNIRNIESEVISKKKKTIVQKHKIYIIDSYNPTIFNIVSSDVRKKIFQKYTFKFLRVIFLNKDNYWCSIT